MATDKEKWLVDRVLHIKGLKKKTEQQELLVLLYEKTNRSAQDEKNLAALVKLEKASAKLAEDRAAVFNAINAQKKAEEQAKRKARTHELCNLGGLVILAGLADSQTGKPTIDKSELLGALMSLANVSPDNPKRVEWKKTGAALLAEKQSATIEA